MIRPKKNIHIIVMAVAVMTIAFSSFTQASEIKESKYKLTAATSFNYLVGDYGQTVDTVITYIPLTTKIKAGRWSGKLTIPYIRITGPGVVVGGGGSFVGTAGTKATSSGLGDVITSLGYKIPFNNYGASVDLVGKIKLPTADEKKKLGTGNTDYTLQVGFTKMLGDAYMNGNVARKFNGTSSTYNLNDVWKYSFGGGYKLNTDTTVGALYSFRGASTATSSDFKQAIGYVTYNIADNLATQLYAGTGFTNASPNFVSGIELKYKFDTFTGPDIW